MRSHISEPEQTRQRLKVALTGLALIVLLIGLAGVIFSAVETEAPVEAAGTAQSDRVANITALPNDSASEAAVVEEPLAELGVAPSKSGEGFNVVVIDQPPVTDTTGE